MHSNCTPLNEIRCYAYFWFPISLFYLKACPLYCTKMHDTIHSIQFVLYLFISLVNFFGRLHTEVVFYLPVSCKVSILSIEGFLKWVYLSSPPPPLNPHPIPGTSYQVINLYHSSSDEVRWKQRSMGEEGNSQCQHEFWMKFLDQDLAKLSQFGIIWCWYISHVPCESKWCVICHFFL